MKGHPGVSQFYLNEVKRIDKVILSQIEFESKTDKKFQTMTNMMFAFSKAMWERNKDLTKITDQIDKNTIAINR